MSKNGAFAPFLNLFQIPTTSKSDEEIDFWNPV